MNTTPENAVIKLVDSDSVIDLWVFTHCPDVDKKYVERLKTEVKGWVSSKD